MREQDSADTAWNRIWFGVGQAAEGIKSSAMASVLLFYYSQVLGLDAKMAGFALLLATITDGVSDILVGRWSDTLHHRWGRRHPLMYAAIIPFSVSFTLLFLPPEGLGQTGLFLWLLVVALIARNAMTLFVIPHYALGAEMSSDYHARTAITACRSFFSFIGTGLVFLAGAWFFTTSPQYPIGPLNPAHYSAYGITLGCIILITLLTSVLFTHNTIPHLPQPRASEHFSLKGSFSDIWEICKLPSFATFLAAFLIWLVGLYLFRAGEIYIATYFWRLDPQLVFFLPLCSAAAFLLSTPVWVGVSRRIGKKWAVIAGLLSGVTTYSLFVLSRIAGFITEELSSYEEIVFVLSFLISCLFASALVIPGAMVADVTDEYQLCSGSRREGVVFGAVNFVAKFSTGIGAQLSGLVIAYAGLAPRSAPASVPIEVSNLLALSIAGCFFLLVCAAMALFLRYPLNQARHDAIRSELADRRAHEQVYS